MYYLTRAQSVCAVAFFVLGIGFSGNLNAQEYGAFVIRNPAAQSIGFNVRFGDGEWKEYRVKAYSALPIYFRLKNGRAPTPEINFDSILGDGRYTGKTYSLDFYAVKFGQAHKGKPYRFFYTNKGKGRDLHSGIGKSGTVRVKNNSKNKISIDCDTVSCVRLGGGQSGTDQVLAGKHTFRVVVTGTSRDGFKKLDEFYQTFTVPADGVLDLVYTEKLITK